MLTGARVCHMHSETIAYDKMYALGRDYDMRPVHEHACRQLIHTLNATNVLNAIAIAEIYRCVRACCSLAHIAAAAVIQYCCARAPVGSRHTSTHCRQR